NGDGLCCQLTHVCPRPKLKTPKDILEVPRNSLEFVKKIGEEIFDEIWTRKWNYEIDVTIKTMKTRTMST
ncbi:unnamed protein product, partial [Rotaria sp. Silwood1]